MKNLTPHLDKTLVDAMIFSAFPGEMEHYHSSIPNLRKMECAPMEYFFGVVEGKSVAITHVGLGKLQATSSLHFAFSCFEPSIALFTGTAGAVDMSLKTGSIIIGERCIDADLWGIHESLTATPFAEALKNRHETGLIPREYWADRKLVELACCETDSWKAVGLLATSDNFPSPKEKIEVLRKSGVSSLDMESAAFYHVARLFKIPALTIRSISNELDHAGADKNIASSDISSGNRAAELALSIIRKY